MKKPPADPKTCASCESYKPVNPGDEAGYCHLMPPVWADGEWARPVVVPSDTCRFWLQKLNS
ncbi:MAG: hypothetical protein WA191_06715 [Telluria sp.]